MRNIGLALSVLVMACAAQAQNLVASPEKGFSPSTQEEVVLDSSSKRAMIEVAFSGGHQERFVFQEGGYALVEEKGLALRPVGLAQMQMGEKKLHVEVLRENLRPDAFHVHSLRTLASAPVTATTNSTIVLAPGESQTVSAPGDGPTQMTIKRLR